MTRLYSYVVVSDHGFAPNPFHGYCTLANCKPRIRWRAQPGDWIVGTGSRARGGPPVPLFAGVDIRKKGVGHRNRFPEAVVREFVRWMRSFEERGILGRPGNLSERARQSLSLR